MKILYVEDQITRNISRITRLFEKYLSKNTKKELEAFDNDSYPPDPDMIKKVVEKSNLIEIEYRFPDALQKVLNNSDKYSLYVVDRNLFEEDGYNLEEVKAIDPSFNEERYETFAEREGDYLLHRLVYNTDVLSKFYFMTAYSGKEEIRGATDIQTHIDFKKFSLDNFIEKGNSADFIKLKSIVDDIDDLNIQNENDKYFRILRKNTDDKLIEFFFEVLKYKDEEKRIHDNLNRLRKIYEGILDVSAMKIPGMKEACAKNKGGKTICWMKDNKHIDNFILRNFLFSIREIANEFGSHKSFPYIPIYEPTLDTVNALVYAMKDVINWFGKICHQS